MSSLACARALVAEVAEIIRPPLRMTVPEAAEKYVRLDIPGGYQGRWSNDLPYYMVEPATCLTSREFDAVIFVGPAQSAKTQALIDNWIAHSVICDPGDMMVVQTSEHTSRDYSKRRVDRLITASPELLKRLVPGNGDNTYDKLLRSGMILSLAWPTKNQLAGKAIGRMALTDYDRMPDDVDGEGPAFDLAAERPKTFMSRGMVLAESSPSKPIIDPKWRAKTAHEAPPTNGILGLYNTGDRRKLYAKCPHCGEYFTPSAGVDAVDIPEEGSIEHRSENTALICTANGCLIFQDAEKVYKRSGIWLREGQQIVNGNIVGDGLKSRRATFWLAGWFAAFQSWRSIIDNYLRALDTYERTGDEEALKAKVNTNMAAPYLTKAQEDDTRDGSYLEERAEPIERYSVDPGVRVLLAAIDIQKTYFDVMVMGIGCKGEQWIVDRFKIRDVDPAAKIEDWDQITQRVVKATYRLQDGLELRIHATAIDSGGRAGVTERAYEYWRELKRQSLGRRVRLVKGGSNNAPRMKESYPDSTGRKDRKSGGRGDVPVLILNTNLLKDAVYADLQRDIPGAGYVHFPDWLPRSFYDELTVEQRMPDGWKNPARRRNEPFDLATYIRGLWLWLKGEKVNWDNPPPWLSPMSSNTNVMSASERRDMKTQPKAPKASRRARFRFN